MKIHLAFHVSKFEPFHQSTILERHIQPHPSLIEIDIEEEFEVKKISTHEFSMNIWNSPLMWI
jgi:hypothetical protein